MNSKTTPIAHARLPLENPIGDFWTAIAMVLLLCPVVTRGITISVDPQNQTVAPGTPVSVSVTIAGLGSGSPPSVGAFDFNLSFDPSILSFTSISFGDQLNLGIGGSITGSSEVNGLVNQFEVSLELPADLDALQRDSFVLTSLTFESIGDGLSHLNITDLTLGDGMGDPLFAGTINGTVRVSSGGGVGTSDFGSTALLMSLGMLGLSAAYRKHL